MINKFLLVVFLMFTLFISYTAHEAWATGENWPDYAITNLRIEPQNPQEGDALVAVFTLANRNASGPLMQAQEVDGLRVVGSVDNSACGQTLGRAPFERLAGRVSFEHRLELSNGGGDRCFLSSGRYTLRVNIDPLHQIAETDEANNEQVIQFEVRPAVQNMPDLIITEVTNVTQDHAERYERNATLFFNVSVENRNYGNGEGQVHSALQNVNVQLTDGHGWTGESMIERLESAGTAQVRLLTRETQPGIKNLTAIVDSHSRIEEANENNNRFAVEAPLEIVEDLDARIRLSIMDSIAPVPQRPVVGQEARFTATILNDSNSDLNLSQDNPVIVSFLVDGNREFRYPLTRLDAHQSRAFTSDSFRVSDGRSVGVRVAVFPPRRQEGVPIEMLDETYITFWDRVFDTQQVAGENPDFIIDGAAIQGDRIVNGFMPVTTDLTIPVRVSQLNFNVREPVNTQVLATNNNGWSQRLNANFTAQAPWSSDVTFNVRGRDLQLGENQITLTVNPDRRIAEVDSANNTHTLPTINVIEKRMPNLAGRGLQEAQALMSSSFIYDSNIVPNPNRLPVWQYLPDVIVTQNIPAGQAVDDGVRVEVALSGPLSIPNFVGRQTGDAVRWLRDEVAYPLQPVFVDNYSSHTPGRLNDILTQSPAANSILRRGTPISFTVKAAMARMPDVHNLYEDEARRLIGVNGWRGDVGVTYENHFRVERTRVIRQTPEAGTEFGEDTRVSLHVSRGAPVMPNIMGQDLGAARDALRNAGWQAVPDVRGEPSLTPERVVRQEPAAETVLAEDTPVAIYMGTEIRMLNVVNRQMRDATGDLTRAGYRDRFILREVQGPEDQGGIVTEQFPAAGTILGPEHRNNISLTYIHIVSDSEREKEKIDTKNENVRADNSPIEAPRITTPLQDGDNHVRGTYNGAYVNAFAELNLNGRNNVVHAQAAANGQFDIFMRDLSLHAGDRVTVTLRAARNAVSQEQRATSDEETVPQPDPLAAPAITEPLYAGDQFVRGTYRRDYYEPSIGILVNGRANGQAVTGVGGQYTVRLDRVLREDEEVIANLSAKVTPRGTVQQERSEAVVVQINPDEDGAQPGKPVLRKDIKDLKLILPGASNKIPNASKKPSLPLPSASRKLPPADEEDEPDSSFKKKTQSAKSLKLTAIKAVKNSKEDSE